MAERRARRRAMGEAKASTQNQDSGGGAMGGAGGEAKASTQDQDGEIFGINREESRFIEIYRDLSRRLGLIGINRD